MSPTDDLEEAYARLNLLEQEAAKTRQALAAVHGTARSRDRMLVVEVGPTGEVEKLDFRSSGYRDLAPQELSALVVGTVQAACADAKAQVEEYTRTLREEQARLLGPLARD